jgi:iron-regulated transporter 1
MTAYLDWRTKSDSSINQAIIGAQRGVGALFGIVGTVLFPCLESSMHIPRAGLLSIWLFWFLLAPAAFTFVVYGESELSDFTLIGCMALSRIGLWSFDLAETQIMQTWTDEGERGTINGMQTGTYQLAYVVIQGAGIVYHDPKDFAALVLFSIGAVFCACVLYTVWLSMKRKHPSMLKMYPEATSRVTSASQAHA